MPMYQGSGNTGPQSNAGGTFTSTPSIWDKFKTAMKDVDNDMRNNDALEGIIKRKDDRIQGASVHIDQARVGAAAKADMSVIGQVPSTAGLKQSPINADAFKAGGGVFTSAAAKLSTTFGGGLDTGSVLDKIKTLMGGE